MCEQGYLLASLGLDVISLAGIGFFEILALNVTVRTAPSLTAHDPEWFSELCFLLTSSPPGSVTALGSQGTATTPTPTPKPRLCLTSPATVT